MKIFEHYRYMRENKYFNILTVLKNGLLSAIVLCIYLSARDLIVHSCAENWGIAVLGSIALYLSFLTTLPFRMDRQMKTLFRILKFSDTDFLLHLLFMESLEIPTTSLLTALLLKDFSIAAYPISAFFLILLLYIAAVCLWYKYVFEKSIGKESGRFPAIASGMRLKNGMGRYLYYTYCASANRFTIWLAQILGFAVIAAGVYYEIPFGFTFYILLWPFVCGIVDLAVSDELNYVLNKLLKKSLHRMKKEKCLHYLIQAAVNTIFILIAYFCCCGEQVNASMLTTMLLLFGYCGIMAVCFVDYVYSFYPRIRDAGNTLVFGTLLFSIPVFGLLIGGSMSIKRRIKKYARDS